jgi:hypothetical protein
VFLNQNNDRTLGSILLAFLIAVTKYLSKTT